MRLVYLLLLVVSFTSCNSTKQGGTAELRGVVAGTGEQGLRANLTPTGLVTLFFDSGQIRRLKPELVDPNDIQNWTKIRTIYMQGGRELKNRSMPKKGWGQSTFSGIWPCGWITEFTSGKPSPDNDACKFSVTIIREKGEVAKFNWKAENAVPINSPGVNPPPSTGRLFDIPQADTPVPFVLSAEQKKALSFELKDARDWFTRDAGSGFSSKQTFRGKDHPYSGDASISIGTIDACLGNADFNNVWYWNHMTFHYYCNYGYLRSCFTGAARRPPAGVPRGTYQSYVAAYNHCLSDDDDFKRYFAGDKVSKKEGGQVAGVDYERRRRVFQYVMLSVYAGKGNGANGLGRKAISLKDSDEIIDSAYEITDDKSCKANRLYVPYKSKISGSPMPSMNGKKNFLYRSRGSYCSYPH